MRKFLCLLLLLSSCNLAPRYCRPCMDLPETWRMEADETTTCANVRWWEEFGDPVLDALIAQALACNKDLQTALWRVMAFAARYQIDSSQLFPQISLGGSAEKQKFPEGTDALPLEINPITPQYTYAFNLSYEIDFWGRVRNLSRAGYAEFLASVENRQNVVLELVSAVAQSYIRLRQLDQELAVSYQTLEARREYVVLATKRFEGGLTSEIEVTQAISLYDETRAFITVLIQEIAVEENNLSILLGEPPTCIVRGEKISELRLPTTLPTGTPCELLERRPDILEAEYQLKAAGARIGVARANFFPQLSLTALFGGDAFDFDGLFSRQARMWSVAGNFLQEIFTGGRLTGALKLSIAEKQELLYQYEQTILTALKEVNDALISHTQAQNRTAIETDRVAAATEYLRLAWLRYYDGQTDYLTVLDAERQLFSAQIEQARAQGDTFRTLVSIYKAVGGGWVIDADSGCGVGQGT